MGFVLVTLGLIAASVWAFAEWGANWIVDPTIALAFLTWAIYLAMVFSRLAVGWRGRKGAYFSIAGFRLRRVDLGDSTAACIRS